MPRENQSVRVPVRSASRRRILVVVGGLRTELAYLIGLRDQLATRVVDVRMVPIPKAPHQVVAAAAELRGPDFDEVWCVFDVDEFDIEEALQAAVRDGIRVAVSNPCFELWLLLHHEDCRAHQSGCAPVGKRLKRHIPTYDKARLNFAHFWPGLANARTRARALENGRPNRNPSTGMWRLVDRIEEQE